MPLYFLLINLQFGEIPSIRKKVLSCILVIDFNLFILSCGVGKLLLFSGGIIFYSQVEFYLIPYSLFPSLLFLLISSLFFWYMFIKFCHIFAATYCFVNDFNFSVAKFILLHSYFITSILSYYSES